jgi:hypothetical protein
MLDLQRRKQAEEKVATPIVPPAPVETAAN